MVNMECKFECGYDSDGEAGPWCSMEEEEGIQDYDEDEVTPTSSHNISSSSIRDLPTSRNGDDEVETPTEPPQSTHPPPPNVHVPILPELLSKMHIPELKRELRSRNLAVSGSKNVLLGRLKDGLKKLLPVIKDGSSDSRFTTKKSGEKKKESKKAEAKKKDAKKFFSDDAFWEDLVPLEEVVEEPLNPTFCQPRAPTIEERDAKFVPVKHNFIEEFEVPKFEATVSIKFILFYY